VRWAKVGGAFLPLYFQTAAVLVALLATILALFLIA
jgi:hypothetical protein